MAVNPKLPTDENVLRVLGVCAKEDVISNLLVYCFNYSEQFQEIFLKFLGGQPFQNCERRAVARIKVREGIPDIVIVGDHEDHHEVIIIENKITAHEGEDQTCRYSSKKCLEGIAQELCLKKQLKPRYYFLNLRNEQAESERFETVSYKALADCLGTISFDSYPLVDQLLKNLLEVLNGYYSYANASEEDNPLEKLRDNENDVLDGRFQYFCSIFESIDFSGVSRELMIDNFASGSYMGRCFYLAQIAKPGWRTEKYDVVNPKRCFNIHFEPTYDLLNQKFGLVLHFETHPYLSKTQAKKQMGVDYESYLRTRQDFINHISRCGLGVGAEMACRSNQILRFKFDMGGLLTVKNYRKYLVDCIAPLIDPIDSFVESLAATN